MAATVSVATLIDRVRRRTEQENSQFVSDLEITDYLNAGIQELSDLIGQASASHYTNKQHTFTADGSSEYFDLPDDFLQLRKLEAQVIGGTNPLWVDVLRVAPGEYNQYRSIRFAPYIWGQVWTLHYDLAGDKLLLGPIPQSGLLLRLTYVPVAPVLVAAGTIDCDYMAEGDTVTVNGATYTGLAPIGAGDVASALGALVMDGSVSFSAPAGNSPNVVTVTQLTDAPVVWKSSNPSILSTSDLVWSTLVNSYNGWLEYAILRACALVKNKAGYDISLEMALLDRMQERVLRATWARNVGNPGHVADNSAGVGWWGSSFGTGGWGR